MIVRNAVSFLLLAVWVASWTHAEQERVSQSATPPAQAVQLPDRWPIPQDLHGEKAYLSTSTSNGSTWGSTSAIRSLPIWSARPSVRSGFMRPNRVPAGKRQRGGNVVPGVLCRQL